MKKIITALSACLIFSSCAPSTPQARIERNPLQFEALNAKEKALVQKGQIDKGMSPDAVMLAWGPPDRRFEGMRNSKKIERWDYTGTQPVYSSYYSSSFGYGYGRRGYSSIDLALGPEVTYVPYHFASVWFVNHRVDAWEKGH
jgi:hypothetical protein